MIAYAFRRGCLQNNNLRSPSGPALATTYCEQPCLFLFLSLFHQQKIDINMKKFARGFWAEKKNIHVEKKRSEKVGWLFVALLSLYQTSTRLPTL